MSLPPGSTLISGTVPQPMALPPGATLVDSTEKTEAKPTTSANFGKRFIESSGLSGLSDVAQHPIESMEDLFSASMGPAKQVVGAVVAPAQHLNDILEAHKAGDKEKVLSSASKFLDSFIPGTGNANQIAQNTLKDIQEGNSGAVAGTATGLSAQLALVKGLSKVGMAKPELARFAYTADGELTPLAKSMLHPTELPETIFRKLVPEPPVYPGAQLPSVQDFYEAKAADLMKRGAQQAILDRQAATAARAAARNAPKSIATSPFEGATSTSTPIGNAELPKPSGLPQGSPTPFVSKFAKPETSRIVAPGSTPPDVKVTYQSVPGQQLFEKMMSGDLDAVNEWRRRGLPLPNNVKYLFEESGTKPWRNYPQ